MSLIKNIMDYAFLISAITNMALGNYKVSVSTSSWDLAVFYCRNDFLTLVTIESETKRNYVQALLSDSGITDDIWIDLRLSDDRLADGSYAYEDSNGIITNYLPWDNTVGEPDKQDTERCIRMTNTGYFRTSPCSKLCHYLCVGSQDVPSDFMGSEVTTRVYSTTTTDSIGDGVWSSGSQETRREALNTKRTIESTVTIQTSGLVHNFKETSPLTNFESTEIFDKTTYVAESTISGSRFSQNEESTKNYGTTYTTFPLSSIRRDSLITESSFTIKLQELTSENKNTNQMEGSITTQTTSNVQAVVHNNITMVPSERNTATFRNTVREALSIVFDSYTCCPVGCNSERFNWSDPAFLRWLSERLDEIRKALKIDKKNTTKFINSKRSFMDKRPSSAVTGSLGASLLFIIASAIIVPDLFVLISFLKKKLKTNNEVT